VNSRTAAIAAAVLVLGALAACSGSPRGGDAVGNPDGATSDLTVDLLSVDGEVDRAPDQDSVSDTQPVDLHRESGLPDGEGEGDPPEVVADTDLSAWPDVMPTDATEVDVETGGPYYCPLGQDGKKELMPDCPYDLPFFLYGMQYIAHGPIQFEVYSTVTNPGLPEAFVLTEGQPVALLRFTWVDPWTNMFADWIGCPPEWPRCKACGGHCFPPQGYVHVIDLETLSVVYSAKEDLPPDLLRAEPCKTSDGSKSFRCFELKVPELAVRLSLGVLGQWHTGTSNVIPDNLEVWHIKATYPDPPIKAIPLPLF